MLRIALLGIFLIATLWSMETIRPETVISAGGAVKDMVRADDRLVLGTDQGELKVYDLKRGDFVYRMRLPEITDFMGDKIPARISSVDALGDRMLVLSDSGKGGFADLRIVENNTSRQILSAEDRRAVIKARFVDADHVLLGYLSDEASLLELSSKKELWRVQMSESKFSDLALNGDRSRAAFGCESGEITVIDAKRGKILKRLKGINKDNLYMVDIKKEYVVGAGQDRRASWYNWKSGRGGFFPAKFFVYAAGLSLDGKKAAYTLDESGSITLFDLARKEAIARLVGHKGILNAILFDQEGRLYSAGDDGKVMIWRLKH